MTITEADRHHLLIALEGAIGEEAAMTLAAHLPPVGWADVATRHDIDHLADTMDQRFQTTRHVFEAMLHREMAGLHREMSLMLRTLFFAILGAFVANAGLVLAVVERSR